MNLLERTKAKSCEALQKRKKKFKDDAVMKTFKKKVTDNNGKKAGEKRTNKQTNIHKTVSVRKGKKNPQRISAKLHERAENGAKRSHSCCSSARFSFLYHNEGKNLAQTHKIFSSFRCHPCCLLSFLFHATRFRFQKVFCYIYLTIFLYSFDFLLCNFHTVTRHTFIQWPTKINFLCIPK